MSVGRSGRRIAREEQVTEVHLDRDPDLAVGVHLRADDVEAEVAVVERVGVRILARLRELAAHRPAGQEVADPVVRIAGGVRALGVAVRARRDRQVQLVEGGECVEVAERLAHRAGGVALPGADALADHAVLDQVAVLVAEDREVVGAVHARRVERAGQGLPEELVRRRVLRRQRRCSCSRCRGCRSRHRTARFRSARRCRAGCERRASRRRRRVDRRDAVVVLLRVPVALVEAEVVRPVVHDVVADEQGNRRGLDVVAESG